MLYAFFLIPQIILSIKAHTEKCKQSPKNNYIVMVDFTLARCEERESAILFSIETTGRIQSEQTSKSQIFFCYIIKYYSWKKMLQSNHFQHFANLSCILQIILNMLADGRSWKISTLKKSTKGPVFTSSKLLKIKGTICLRVRNGIWLYLIQSFFVYVNWI